MQYLFEERDEGEDLVYVDDNESDKQHKTIYFTYYYTVQIFITFC